jgi:hypothetical protein
MRGIPSQKFIIFIDKNFLITSILSSSLHASIVLVDQGLILVEVSSNHSHTPHSVGLP